MQQLQGYIILGFAFVNNNLTLCFGTSVNVKNVTFPITFTTVAHLTFGIKYARGQYGYNTVTELSGSGFTLWDYLSGLYQMYIAIGF